MESEQENINGSEADWRDETYPTTPALATPSEQSRERAEYWIRPQPENSKGKSKPIPILGVTETSNR